MKIDVSGIIKQPGSSISFSKQGAIDTAFDAADLVVLKGPVTIKGVATSTGDGIYVQAEAKGVVQLTCSRCLGEYGHSFRFGCEARFHKDAIPGSSDEEKDIEVFPLEGDFCNLDEMIKHELILDLPMKPLCDADCKGFSAVTNYDTDEGEPESELLEGQTTVFGKKLLEALGERSKKHGSSEKKNISREKR